MSHTGFRATTGLNHTHAGRALPGSEGDVMRADDPRHGTTNGARVHARENEKPCEPCRIARNADRALSRAKYASHELALTNGTWQPVRGVLRWVPNEVGNPPARRKVDVHELIACPTCHARVDETCRTRSGRRTLNHNNRLTQRLCSCGARVQKLKRRCEECAAEADRMSKKLWRERRAANREDVAA